VFGDFKVVVWFLLQVKYARDPDNATKACKARGSDLRVHFKVLMMFEPFLFEKLGGVCCSGYIGYMCN
jgi:hypothetical protein